VKLGDRTYKNHLDGYDQTAAITGKGPSTRHEIFYLGESTVGAVRIDDYKYRFIDQPNGWLGAKTQVDIPYLINCASIRLSARAGPTTERKKARSNTSIGSSSSSGALFSSSRSMGKELQTFLDYPPMQKGASFNLEAVKAEMAKKMHKRKRQQRHRPVTRMTFVADGSQGPSAFH
jgi:arylsulfatase